VSTPPPFPLTPAERAVVQRVLAEVVARRDIAASLPDGVGDGLAHRYGDASTVLDELLQDSDSSGPHRHDGRHGAD
jgi:hypothetical protein